MDTVYLFFVTFLIFFVLVYGLSIIEKAVGNKKPREKEKTVVWSPHYANAPIIKETTKEAAEDYQILKDGIMKGPY